MHLQVVFFYFSVEGSFTDTEDFAAFYGGLRATGLPKSDSWA